MKDNYVPSNSNSDVTPVASHSCTDSSSIRHPSVPQPPFTVKFSFCLEKDCRIDDEFPYESLARTVAMSFDEEILLHPHFCMKPIEQLIITGIEMNKAKALSGLAFEDDYDRIIIKEWSLLNETGSYRVATQNPNSNTPIKK